jgi:hypothetical protein
MFRAPALGRHVHRELLRSAWLDVTPRISATACHQSNYFETDSRYRWDTLPIYSRQRGAPTSLPAPGMHLKVWVLAEACELHQGLTRTVGPERVALLSTTVPTRLPAGDDEGGKRLSGGARPQRVAHINALAGIEAQIPQAIGRESAAVTGATERGGR